jgi:hypothetical protein
MDLLGVMALVVIFGVVYFVRKDIRARRASSAAAGIEPTAAQRVADVAMGVAWSPGRPGSGWYPDPEARYPRRYFDGQVWTSRVSLGLGMPEQADAGFSEGMNQAR